MKIIDDRLNPQVLSIEDAETEIREVIMQSFLQGASKQQLNIKINKIIARVEKAVDKKLKSAIRRSLLAFANRQYNTLQNNWGAYLPALLVLIGYRQKHNNAGSKQELNYITQQLAQRPIPRGIQPDYYARDLIKRVDSVLNELCEQQPLDPNDISGRNNLRNKAEMEIRYQRHQDEIAKMKEEGGLWICSVHADCSDRCSFWQGRIYSTNGTSGTTEDGREYIPLEWATGEKKPPKKLGAPATTYKTKAGVTYKNGLLGFNCRHTLTPFKPYKKPPTISAAERKKEYSITLRQRQFENEIRKAKVEAIQNKIANPVKSREAASRAKKLYERYKTFSHNNNRAYYPDRTKIR